MHINWIKILFFVAKTRNYDIFVTKTRNYDIFVAKIYDYALIDSFEDLLASSIVPQVMPPWL